MRLAISNIAWDVSEDESVAALLQCYKVDAIDIAPGKYFPRPTEATEAEILKVKQWWASRGVEITGMQALMFGTTGLNVFGTPASQDAMLEHLGGVCRIAGVLGATRLVFGSPKNRNRSGLSDADSLMKAAAFFRRLGDIAAAEGVMVCLEPNPPCYAANFMTTSAETAKVVETVDHPAIRMQLDTGAMTINEEDPAAVVLSCAGLIGHIHASEPNLVPLGDGGTNHNQAFLALSQHLPKAMVSIEMVATENEPHLSSIERALQVAARSYRPTVPGQTA
jgi:D-psicose/D-tagatose/L-ribulose 3-epimerase